MKQKAEGKRERGPIHTYRDIVTNTDTHTDTIEAQSRQPNRTMQLGRLFRLPLCVCVWVYVCAHVIDWQTNFDTLHSTNMAAATPLPSFVRVSICLPLIKTAVKCTKASRKHDQTRPVGEGGHGQGRGQRHDKCVGVALQLKRSMRQKKRLTFACRSLISKADQRGNGKYSKSLDFKGV